MIPNQYKKKQYEPSIYVYLVYSICPSVPRTMMKPSRASNIRWLVKKYNDDVLYVETMTRKTFKFDRFQGVT